MADNSFFDKVECVHGFNFSDYTTYGLGGKAEIAYFPKNETEAVEIFRRLRADGKKFIILGNGSNVLVSDNGYDGSVICTKKLEKIEYLGDYIYCQSGVAVGNLLKFCKENSLGGLEFLAGIPASVGGLVLMNAAAGGKSISQNVESVKIFDGETRILSNSCCNFGDKHSTMRDIICVILGAKLKVYPDIKENIAYRINYYLKKRSFQPKGRSCGCVFKNYEEQSAGKIIDDAGLKGLKIGGATVSCRHANFIINDGGSSNDVYRLIKEVKRLVLIKTKIELCEEVIYIGEFNETDS